MRRIRIFVLGGILTVAGGRGGRAQQPIDGIAARVENDILLMSDIRELRGYQMLTDGKSETTDQLLERLIDQWVVRTEAEAAGFPHPSDADVTYGVEHLQKSFASPQEYESRKKESGLSDIEVREMTAAQLFLGSYLESRFRPSIQVDSNAIENFYKSEVVPQAKRHGQEPPSLESARESIQEALVQRGINEQADRWLKESRARLHVEKISREDSR